MLIEVKLKFDTFSQTRFLTKLDAALSHQRSLKKRVKIVIDHQFTFEHYNLKNYFQHFFHQPTRLLKTIMMQSMDQAQTSVHGLDQLSAACFALTQGNEVTIRFALRAENSGDNFLEDPRYCTSTKYAVQGRYWEDPELYQKLARLRPNKSLDLFYGLDRLSDHLSISLADPVLGYKTHQCERLCYFPLPGQNCHHPEPRLRVEDGMTWTYTISLKVVYRLKNQNGGSSQLGTESSYLNIIKQLARSKLGGVTGDALTKLHKIYVLRSSSSKSLVDSDEVVSQNQKRKALKAKRKQKHEKIQETLC